MNFIMRMASGLFGRLFDTATSIVKFEVAAAYVNCVAKARQAFIALLSLAVSLLLALAGFLLIHVAVFAWLPWSMPVKALVLLILGIVYLGCGMAAALVASSDRTWMKFARVDRMLAAIALRRG